MNYNNIHDYNTILIRQYTKNLEYQINLLILLSKMFKVKEKEARKWGIFVTNYLFEQKITELLIEKIQDFVSSLKCNLGTMFLYRKDISNEELRDLINTEKEIISDCQYFQKEINDRTLELIGYKAKLQKRINEEGMGRI